MPLGGGGAEGSVPPPPGWGRGAGRDVLKAGEGALSAPGPRGAKLQTWGGDGGPGREAAHAPQRPRALGRRARPARTLAAGCIVSTWIACCLSKTHMSGPCRLVWGMTRNLHLGLGPRFFRGRF